MWSEMWSKQTLRSSLNKRGMGMMHDGRVSKILVWVTIAIFAPILAAVKGPQRTIERSENHPTVSVLTGFKLHLFDNAKGRNTDGPVGKTVGALWIQKS